MENFLRKPMQVPFDSLYLDPNNPRLAREELPGYEDPKRLFEPKLQVGLEGSVKEQYEVPELAHAIVAQGWMPIDSIVVWTFPSDPAKHIVVEGNRRTVALRELRKTILPRERNKLESLKKKKLVAKRDIEVQEKHVKQIEQVIKDTDTITVLPLDAKDVHELKMKLPRVLAVRHIQGAKGWGNYAEDLWLLNRYQVLFEEKFPGEDLRWEASMITRVADEASLGDIKAKRQLQAASAFSHFQAEYEDQLPKDESFRKEDYYVFENIAKKTWLREQFGLGQDALHLEREDVLFKWVFEKPRGRTAEENKNKFYRQENVLLWDQMRRYDQEQTPKTSFAAAFDVNDPDSAPFMNDVEASWLTHKTQRAPTEVLEKLLESLDTLTAGTLLSQGVFLRDKLEAVIRKCEDCIGMIEGANTRANKRRA